jgi:TFIIB-like protein
LQSFAARYEARAVRLADAVAVRAGLPVEREGEAICPWCNEPMRRSTFAPGGPEVDTCDRHGTWFDRRELQALASTLHGPHWPRTPSPPATGPAPGRAHGPYRVPGASPAPDSARVASADGPREPDPDPAASADGPREPEPASDVVTDVVTAVAVGALDAALGLELFEPRGPLNLLFDLFDD